MDTGRYKILSVDDEPMNQMVIEEIMEDKYELKLVYSGEECLEQVESFAPDVILLDISMPGIDGYTTCEKLKQNNATRLIPVIFVSALTSTEERLRGYEVGAEDYIPKPYDHDELLKKIERCLENRQEVAANSKIDIEKIEQELAFSREVAMDAMRYTSELGIVIHFFETSSNCKDYKELSDCIIEAIQRLELKCTVQLRDDEHILNLSNTGVVSPMEASVMDAAKDKGRFFDIDAKTFVNYKHSSILIKNMPLDDELKYGKLKDILGALGNSAEDRAKAIATENRIKRNRQEIIDLVKNTIVKINSQFMERNRDTTAVLENMVRELRSTISKMDLLEYQEQELHAIMESFISQNEVVVNKSLDLNEAANETYATLNEIFTTLIGD